MLVVAMTRVVLAMMLSTEPTGPTRPVTEAIAVSPGATCLDHAAVTKYVAMWLEREQIDAAIAVEVNGDPHAASDLSFVIARGSVTSAPRHLRNLPNDCAALAAAVGLAVAVAIDASVQDGAFETTPTAVDTPTAITLTPPPPPRNPTPAPTPVRPGVVWFATAGASLAAGLTDGLGYGAELRTVLRLRRPVEFDLGGGAWWAPRGELATDRVRSTLAHADLRACGRIAARHVIGRACAAVTAGGLRVEGSAPTHARTSTVPWVAVGPAFEIVTPVRHRLAFAARLDVWVPILRTNMVALGDQGRVVAAQRLPPVGLALTLGPFVRLSMKE